MRAARAAAAAALALLGLGCAGGKGVKGLDAAITPRVLAESGPMELFPVCSEIKLPCGWEMMPSDADRATQPVANLRESDTARAFLDRIVGRHPGYRWFSVSGVINVVPRDLGANDPLDRQVWVNLDGVASDAALEKIVASAGLRLLKPLHSADGGYGAARFGRVRLRLQGLRLRVALNRLVAADGQSVWWCAPGREPETLRCGLLSWREGAP